MAETRDSNLIVTCGSGMKVRRWDASTMEAIGRHMNGYSYSTMTAVICEDGKLIVTGLLDRTARRWDARTGEIIGLSRLHHHCRIDVINSNAQVTRLITDSYVVIVIQVALTITQHKPVIKRNITPSILATTLTVHKNTSQCVKCCLPDTYYY